MRRWLVLSMIAAVAGIGVLAYWDESRRAHAELADLGAQQVLNADAAALAFAARFADAPTHPEAVLRVLDRADERVVIVPPGGGAQGLDGTAVGVPSIVAAIARGDRVVRVDPADAASLGLPDRTAMAGIAQISTGPARGWVVAVAASAGPQRDRNRQGLERSVLAIVLAAGLVSAFGGLALVRQRKQLVLERELAI